MSTLGRCAAIKPAGLGECLREAVPELQLRSVTALSEIEISLPRTSACSWVTRWMTIPARRKIHLTAGSRSLWSEFAIPTGTSPEISDAGLAQGDRAVLLSRRESLLPLSGQSFGRF
jgi:hypothetical protein